MKKLGKTGYNGLKLAHIFFAAIWTGSAAALLLILLAGFDIKAPGRAGL